MFMVKRPLKMFVLIYLSFYDINYFYPILFLVLNILETPPSFFTCQILI